MDCAGAARRAWYRAPIAEFLRADVEVVLAQLVENSGFDVLLTQRDAWIAQILVLREQLAGLDGSLFFEFSIPRMGTRIDVARCQMSMILLWRSPAVIAPSRRCDERSHRGAAG